MQPTLQPISAHVEVWPLVVAHVNSPPQPVEAGVQQQRMDRPLLQAERRQGGMARVYVRAVSGEVGVEWIGTS